MCLNRNFTLSISRKILNLLRFFFALCISGVAGLAVADYEAGVNAAFAGDFDTAYKEFSAAAEEGLDLAQYNLAILYFTGQGVEQDLKAAFEWTEAAAQQGHLAAQFNLATLYYDGQGVARDRDLGVEWFTRAAKAGHPDAAFVLAKMYEEGEHVPEDLAMAHAWAAMAAKNEHADGAALRDQIQAELSSAQLSQARRQFATWQIE